MLPSNVASTPATNNVWLPATNAMHIGLLNSLPTDSADFYNWNKVKIRYCDGASFSGHVQDEVKVRAPGLMYFASRPPSSILFSFQVF
jgi:hypothetical protein